MVGTERPRLARVPSTYCTWGPGDKPPCASGTYTTREAVRVARRTHGAPGRPRQPVLDGRDDARDELEEEEEVLLDAHRLGVGVG